MHFLRILIFYSTILTQFFISLLFTNVNEVKPGQRARHSRTDHKDLICRVTNARLILVDSIEMLLVTRCVSLMARIK